MSTVMHAHPNAMPGHDFPGADLMVLKPGLIGARPTSHLSYAGDYPTECISLCIADAACTAVITVLTQIHLPSCHFRSGEPELVTALDHAVYIVRGPAMPPPPIAVPANVSAVSGASGATPLILSAVAGAALALALALSLALVLVAFCVRHRSPPPEAVPTGPKADADEQHTMMAEPPIWERFVDPTTNQPYLWNRETGETTWDSPSPQSGPGAKASEVGTGAVPASDAAALECWDEDAVVGTIDLSAPRTYSIGRMPASDLVVPHESCSRRHARIVVAADGGVSLEDIGSSGGTFVNGAGVAAHTPVPLTSGALVQFARCRRRYRLRLGAAEVLVDRVWIAGSPPAAGRDAAYGEMY